MARLYALCNSCQKALLNSMHELASAAYIEGSGTPTSTFAMLRIHTLDLASPPTCAKLVAKYIDQNL